MISMIGTIWIYNHLLRGRLKNLNILRKYVLHGKISKDILGRCKKMTGKIPQPVGQKN